MTLLAGVPERAHVPAVYIFPPLVKFSFVTLGPAKAALFNKCSNKLAWPINVSGLFTASPAEISANLFLG